MKKVNYLEPRYYREFNCLGGECKDTCCGGWEINIDKSTYNHYKKHSEIIKHIEKINDSQSDLKYARFKMADRQDVTKCSLLDNRGLCSVYTSLGEKSMCNTCKQFPRNIYNFKGNYVRTMSLACEEAARLALLSKKPMEFIETTGDLEYKDINTFLGDGDNWGNYLPLLRESFINILKDRRYDINTRLVILGLYCDNLEKYLSKSSEIPNVIEVLDSHLTSGDFSESDRLGEVNLKLQFNNYIQLLNKCKSDISVSNVIGNYIENSIGSMKNYEELGKLNSSYKKLLKDYDYIFENYLVNTVASISFWSKDSLISNYFELILKQVYIRLITYGLSESCKELDLLNTVVKCERHIGHSNILRDVLNQLKKAGVVNLPTALCLIRC